MKTVAIAVSLLVFFVIGYIASFQGLDLRRRSSWLYGAISFLCGFTGVLLLSGNLIEGLKGGAIFAFLTLFGGATMLRHKQKYQGMARSLLLQYGNDDHPSLFGRLVKKLLGKYK